MGKKFLKILSVVTIVTLATAPVMAEQSKEKSSQEVDVNELETKDLEDKEVIDEDIPNVDNLLTIEKAIEKAISNDTNLVIYNRDLELYEAQIEQINDYASERYLSILIDVKDAKQKMEFQKDIITKNIVEKYQNIILLQKNIELLKQQIELNEAKVKQAELQKSKGYIDEVTYNKTIKVLEDIKLTEIQTQRQLNDIKKSFNQMTLCDVDKFTLYAPITYELFEVETTISAYAKGKSYIMTDIANQRLELSETKYWETFANSEAPTYDIYLQGKSAIKNNKDTMKDIYDQYVLMIEMKYTDLQKKLESINTKKKDIEDILKDEKILDIKYKNGYISQMDYNTQKITLLSKEVEYIGEVYAYNIMKMQLEKPWVMINTTN